jgi:hypothetical protein
MGMIDPPISVPLASYSGVRLDSLPGAFSRPSMNICIARRRTSGSVLLVSIRVIRSDRIIVLPVE